MKNYILVIDEGTTSVKALLFNRDMELLGAAARPIPTLTPGAGLAEQDPLQIYNRALEACREVVKQANVPLREIAGLAITGQRVSWLCWDARTGLPLHNLVLWQDGRGAAQLARTRADTAFTQQFPARAQRLNPIYTPLQFAATCAMNPEFAAAVQGGEVLWGNVDSWLLYKLTGGRVHATSASTASSSSMFDNAALHWELEPPAYFGMREDMFPSVYDEMADYGTITADILGVELPVCCMVADQQAAMLAQGCLNPTTAKCDNASGTFVNVNIGPEYRQFKDFFTMVAWRINGRATYMLEGNSFATGSCIDWVKDTMGLVPSLAQFDSDAESVPDSGGVFFVPALTGLTGPPFVDLTARASFMGIGAAAQRAHFVRAVLDAVAYVAAGIVGAVLETGADIRKLSVSGGVAGSHIVNQLMANLLDMEISRPASVEMSALGAAELAAAHLGWFPLEDLDRFARTVQVYCPDENRMKDAEQYQAWRRAVRHSMGWAQP